MTFYLISCPCRFHIREDKHYLIVSAELLSLDTTSWQMQQLKSLTTCNAIKYLKSTRKIKYKSHQPFRNRIPQQGWWAVGSVDMTFTNQPRK